MAIFKRIPARGEVAAVYALIVLMVYTWEIMWFFWKLPSWLFFLNAGEILIVVAYILGTAFLESLTVLIAPVLLGMVLPRKWFLDSFVARGGALVLSSLGYMMILASQFQGKDDYPSLSLKPWSAALAAIIIILIVFLAGRIGFVRKALEVLADRATIFLYLSMPLSLLSLTAVLVHWIV